ncbi:MULTISPECIES: dihydromonapterin reductase [unclassified Agarivorans]|uniref:dihydromonapterin reductase n=1 Tax=unclassified Agarivorans TaxID=2636026 RepID=UPI003D7D7A91
MPIKVSEIHAPVLITGAGQRLGLSIAKDLLAQGYPLLISYRSETAGVAELRELGADCVAADFSQDAGIQSFITYVLNHYSVLRAVIHNASQWLKNAALDDEHELMRQMWCVHVTAPYQMNLAFESLLNQQHQTGETSDIIHLTDYVAEKGSAKHIAYAASKAGLANLSLSFAARLAPAVKVNSIAPSLLMFNQHDDAAYRRKASAKSLMAKEGGATEAVAAVNFIMNSQYLTGRCIALDGGRHLV